MLSFLRREPPPHDAAVYVRTEGRRRLYFGKRTLLHPNYPECGPCNGEGWKCQYYGIDESTGPNAWENRPAKCEIEDCFLCGGTGQAKAKDAGRGLLRLQ